MVAGNQPNRKSRRPLAWCLGVATLLALARAQTPQQAAADVAKQLVAEALPELQQIAKLETQKVLQKVPKQVEASDAAVKQAIAGELEAASADVKAEQQREDAKVSGLPKVVEQARAEAVPLARAAAQEWSRKVSSQRVHDSESAELQRSIASEAKAESLRADAYSETEQGAVSTNALVALAGESEGLKNTLSTSHVEDKVRSFTTRNQNAQSSALKSLRVTKTAEALIKEAETSAAAALKRAEKAEDDAKQALATAHRNTERIASLKLRTQGAYQKANNLALTQHVRG